MVNLIIQLIIVLLVCGFLLFIWNKFSAVISQWIAQPFMALIDILIWILVGAIILFYAVIPILHALGNMGTSLIR